MKALVDTNIIMDALTEREPFADNAKRVMEIFSDKKAGGFIAAHTVTNLFYLLRHDFSIDERREVLLDLFDIFQVEQIDTVKLKSALLKKDYRDFEDCLQSECAEAVQADFIITRNVKDFVNGSIPCISPEDFCAMFK